MVSSLKLLPLEVAADGYSLASPPDRLILCPDPMDAGDAADAVMISALVAA